MYVPTSELEKELADIGKHRFYLAMIDRWDDEVYAINRRLWEREYEIQEILKERGNTE